MRSSIVAIAVVAALTSAGVAAGRPAGSLPGNLCTLNVKQQLKALPVGTTACKQSKTGHIGSVTIEGANWGSLDHAIALVVYANVPKSRFLHEVGKSGTKVSLTNGNVGWLEVGASGVGLEAWINGFGTQMLLHTPPQSPGNNKKYAAPVLAFAEAVAKQI